MRSVKSRAARYYFHTIYDAGGRLSAEYTNAASAANAPAVTSYLTTDSLGSPRIITDNAGKVASRRDFMPFGEEAASNQRGSGLGYAANDKTRQKFTGYERDAESELEFAQARYYNSKHGRFTTVDPMPSSATVGNPQTFNRYSYVTNSPYRFVDPTGMMLSDIGVYQTGDPQDARIAEQESLRDLQLSVNSDYIARHHQTQQRQIIIENGTDEQTQTVRNAFETLMSQAPANAGTVISQYVGNGAGPTLTVQIYDDETFEKIVAGDSKVNPKSILARTMSGGGNNNLLKDSKANDPNPETKANAIILLKASAINTKQETGDRAANRETLLEAIFGHEIAHANELTNDINGFNSRNAADKSLAYLNTRSEIIADRSLKYIAFERSLRHQVTGFKENLRFP